MKQVDDLTTAAKELITKLEAHLSDGTYANEADLTKDGEIRDKVIEINDALESDDHDWLSLAFVEAGSLYADILAGKYSG